MKHCICKAISANLDELRALARDLRAFGLEPIMHDREIVVEFSENALIQPVLDLFDEFEQSSYHVEF